MGTDVEAIKGELKDFKNDVGKRFDNLHGDLSDLTAAMRDLIKLDGYIQRVADMTNRIGKQADDLEIRIRRLEVSDAGNSKTVGRFDRLIDRILQGFILIFLAYIGFGGQ